MLWWTLAATAAGFATLSLHAGLSSETSGCPTTAMPPPPPAGADEGLADRLPPGTRAVAVPISGSLLLVAGDLVDLVAPVLPEVEGVSTTSADGASRTVAEAAVVVHVAPEAITVALPEDDAAAAALAISQGGTTVLLRSSG